MGRRPIAATARSEEQSPLLKPGNPNPPKDGNEKLPESSNPSLAHPEITRPSSNYVKLRSKMQAKSSNSSMKRVKKHTTSTNIRRSGRIGNAITTTQSQEVHRIINEMVVSESEEEEEMPVVHRELELPNPNASGKGFEEKVDYLIQLVEAQAEAIKALNSNVNGDSSPADAKYKSLYIDSQKKIEALKDENHQLALKLENALGKLEAYEKGTRAYTEVLEKLKDMVMISNLTKAAETAVNVSSQAMQASLGARTSPAKRKRVSKENKN